MSIDEAAAHAANAPQGEKPVAYPDKTVDYGAIGWAVNHLRHGHRVRRKGWNGKGMWLELQRPDANSKMTLPYVFMKTADGHLVPWLCSQTDLLASDWELAKDT